MNNEEKKEFEEVEELSKKVYEGCIVLKTKLELEDEDAKKAMDDIIKMISRTSLAISMFKLAYLAQLLNKSDDKKSKTQA